MADRVHEYGGGFARAEALAEGDPDWMNATGMTELQRLEKNLADDIVASLMTTNEIDDGSHEYFEKDGVLFVNLYTAEAPADENGFPKPEAVYRIDLTVTKQEAE